MKETDVEQRYDCGQWRPTINVKWSPWMPDLIRKYEGKDTHEFGDDTEFWAWVHEQDDTELLDQLDAFELPSRYEPLTRPPTETRNQ